MIPFKNKNIFTQRPFFTHFASIPLIEQEHRTTIKTLQQKIRAAIHSHPKYVEPEILKEHHHELCHLTLFKLTLRHSQTRNKMVSIIEQHSAAIKEILSSMVIEIVNVKYFTRFNKNEKCNEITVIYGELSNKVVDSLNVLIDKLMRQMLKQEIVVVSELKEMNVFYDHNLNLYKPATLHISLFRARNLHQDAQFLDIFKLLQQQFTQIQAQCQFFDISTMGKEYDQSKFYLPLHRICIRPNIQPEKKEQKAEQAQVIAFKQE